MKWNLIIALMAFLGTAVGASVSSYFQHERWVKVTHYEQNKEILKERIRLIERTSKAFSSQTRAETLAEILSIDSNKVNEIYDICMKEIERNGNIEICEHVKSSENGNSINAELNNLSAEINTVLLMNSIYFCDQTKKSLGSLSTFKKWWLIPSEKHEEVIGSMLSELHCNIP